MPTLPVDHGRDAAHSTAFDHVGRLARARPSRDSRSSRRSRAGRPSRTCSRAPSASRPRRGRGSGPTGRSTVRSGRRRCPGPVPTAPVCPEWPKYGPIERITGVFASSGRSDGLRMSACSFDPVRGVDRRLRPGRPPRAHRPRLRRAPRRARQGRWPGQRPAGGGKATTFSSPFPVLAEAQGLIPDRGRRVKGEPSMSDSVAITIGVQPRRPDSPRSER